MLKNIFGKFERILKCYSYTTKKMNISLVLNLIIFETILWKLFLYDISSDYPKAEGINSILGILVCIKQNKIKFLSCIFP